MALLVLVVLIAVVAELALHSGVEYRQSSAAETGNQIKWALRSGLLYAQALVSREQNPDGLSFPLQVGDVSITGLIEDENAKLCVNSLVGEDGEIDPVVKSVLTALLIPRFGAERAGRIIEQMRDWIDADSAGAFESGVPNRPFLLLEELADLPDIDRGDLPRDQPAGLSRLLTVSTDGGINFNTAGEEVIRALLHGVPEDAVTRALNSRKTSPLPGLHDLEVFVGKLPEETSEKITFSSSVFKVNLTAEAGNAVRRAEAIIDRPADAQHKPIVKMWREWWPQD